MNKFSVLFTLLLLAVLCHAGPLGKSRLRATHVNPSKSNNLFVWPNTYYDRPNHRYPYYDHYGRGRLLYGYGGSSLYKYSVFKPLEGYFK